jgi:hypothetical protein
LIATVCVVVAAIGIGTVKEGQKEEKNEKPNETRKNSFSFKEIAQRHQSIFPLSFFFYLFVVNYIHTLSQISNFLS